MLIHEAVLDAARRHPDATAFGGDEITYGELERVVRGLAARLRAETGGGGRVAIVAPKSPAAVMGMLATLTAGLAYVPVEKSASGTRLGIDVRGKMRAAVVKDKPLYRKPADAVSPQGEVGADG